MYNLSIPYLSVFTDHPKRKDMCLYLFMFVSNWTTIHICHHCSCLIKALRRMHWNKNSELVCCYWMGATEYWHCVASGSRKVSLVKGVPTTWSWKKMVDCNWFEVVLRFSIDYRWWSSDFGIYNANMLNWTSTYKIRIGLDLNNQQDALFFSSTLCICFGSPWGDLNLCNNEQVTYIWILIHDIQIVDHGRHGNLEY